MIQGNLFWEILNASVSILEYILMKLIFDDESEKKLSNKKIYFNFIISLCISISFLLFDIQHNIRLFLNIINLIIFYKLNYNEKLSKGILIVLIYIMTLMGAEVLSMSILIKVNDLPNAGLLLHNTKYRLEGMILSKSLLIVLILIYKYRNLKINISKKEILYMSIPVIANVFSISLVCNYFLKLNTGNFKESPFILLMPIILFGSNVSIIFILSKIIKDREAINESKCIREKMDIQYKHYKSLKESNIRIRQLYHDMKNHMMCIEEMCNSKNAKEYIKDINKELNEHKNSFNTGNMILDIILSEKEQICKDKNIDFIADINFKMCHFVDMMDTCSIFSNIIDNAIEACEKINTLDIHRQINIRGTYLNQIFILKAENSKENNIIKKENKILTSKNNKFYHGMGISSIERIIKKYNGEINIEYTNYNFMLKLMIPIKCNIK
ncbi:ATP-binding protein [Romboutsia maritimum]|uniref:ATP-binding protein n=1 Tax=Romboutsia maritimum TaxID=2020948 RepID=A0A371ISA5_9FIRM|nr:sensor histidine kinase [Romboutsia maritimum]RDY23367.1 ATP-binding protein [Romboutsia maritimum]